MAQISISETHFAALTRIARERDVSPDQLVESMIEQLEADDQVTFWGPNIVAELQQAQQAYEQIQHHEYLTGEEFQMKRWYNDRVLSNSPTRSGLLAALASSQPVEYMN